MHASTASADQLNACARQGDTEEAAAKLKAGAWKAAKGEAEGADTAEMRVGVLHLARSVKR